MKDVSQIWYALNEAVQGRIPVFELASRCVGLPKETIDELCDKLMADLHVKPSTYHIWIKQQKIREVSK